MRRVSKGGAGRRPGHRAHFRRVYGAGLSKDTVTRITDRVIEEMQAWWARPLEGVYAAVFFDAIR